MHRPESARIAGNIDNNDDNSVAILKGPLAMKK